LTDIRIITVISLFLAGSSFSFCQERELKEVGPEGTDILAGWGRVSAKVNTVDLACAIPNLGLEFDLGKDKYSKNSLGITTRYNWNEWHIYKPSLVFNLFDVKPEYRRYVRGLERTKGVFYWGVYCAGGKYSFKFTETGSQGYMCGAGVSLGIALPLHEYKKFAIDLELGGSLGAYARTKDAYRLSDDGLKYVMLPEESEGFRIVPWPVVSELRVALAFRKISVKHRYNLTTDETTALRRKKIAKNEKKQE